MAQNIITPSSKPTCLWRWNRVFRNVGIVGYLPTCLWIWNRQSVPKRRHIKFRHRGIIQKKTYNNIWHVTRSRAPPKLSRYGVTKIRGNVTSV